MLTLDQIKERRSGIGGSDASAVLGLSKYKTPVSVYLDKLEEGDPEQIDNIHIRVGNKLEPFMREIFSLKTNYLVEYSKTNDPCLRHPDHSFMIANLDGYVKELNAVVEFKTCSTMRKEEWGDEMTDNVPQDYLVQCAHYMEVINADQSFIAVCMLSDDLKYVIDESNDPSLLRKIAQKTIKFYKILRNKELGHIIIEKERNFWMENVQKKIIPSLTTMEDAHRLWPVSTDKQVVANKEHMKAVQDLQETKEKIRFFEELEEKQKLSVASILQDANVLLDSSGNQLLSYKNVKTKRIDTNTLKESHPDIYESFSKTIESRVLRFSKSKGV